MLCSGSALLLRYGFAAAALFLSSLPKASAGDLLYWESTDQAGESVGGSFGEANAGGLPNQAGKV